MMKMMMMMMKSVVDGVMHANPSHRNSSSRCRPIWALRPGKLLERVFFPTHHRLAWHELLGNVDGLVVVDGSNHAHLPRGAKHNQEKEHLVISRRSPCARYSSRCAKNCRAWL